MSNEQLRMNLASAGYDAETVAGYGRPELLSLYAEYLAMPSQVVATWAGKLATEGMGPDKDGATAGIQCQEMMLRERKVALRERELSIREQELARLQNRDVEEKSRRDTLIGQTKFYGDALKHSLPKMTDDPGELPAYFKAVENLFSLYEAPKIIQSKLLIPVLKDKAKSLLARLQKGSLDKFEEV